MTNEMANTSTASGSETRSTSATTHKTDQSLTELCQFLDSSPSPYHAVTSATHALVAGGFAPLDERDAWPTSAGKWYVVRGGAVIAWSAPDGDPIQHGIHIVGAHTDSPNLRVKPHPDVASSGWRQIGVEIYGGALANSWLDRDLGLSGRIMLRDGSHRLVLIDRPIARVAQLAIHLDREVNEKGLVLDKQLHLTPLTGLGPKVEHQFRDLVASEVGVRGDDVLNWDLMLNDLTPARTIGFENELLASARIDNLFSCWASISALVDASAAPHDRVLVAALFDHEEIGSESTTGAAGPFLETTLLRILSSLGIDAIEDRARTFAVSSCVSADMAHSVHPNYADRHEPDHRPIPNQGPVIKVNANQRYATDAATASLFQIACERAGVPVQTFVSRNSQPCGSTIGPITSTRLGIPTVDVGCAMLSMHSARELCGAADADLMRRALRSYYAGS
jgi:aspartyl aminopeptidase